MPIYRVPGSASVSAGGSAGGSKGDGVRDKTILLQVDNQSASTQHERHTNAQQRQVYTNTCTPHTLATKQVNRKGQNSTPRHTKTP